MNGFRLLRTGLLLVAVVGTVLGCTPTPGPASDPQRLPQAPEELDSLAALSDPPTDPPTPVPTAIAEAANGGGGAYPPGGGGGGIGNGDDGTTSLGDQIRTAQLQERQERQREARRLELARFNTMFQLSPDLREAGFRFFETNGGTYNNTMEFFSQYYASLCQLAREKNGLQQDSPQVPVQIPHSVIRSNRRGHTTITIEFTAGSVNCSLLPQFVVETKESFLAQHNNDPNLIKQAIDINGDILVFYEITPDGQLIVHLFPKWSVEENLTRRAHLVFRMFLKSLFIVFGKDNVFFNEDGILTQLNDPVVDEILDRFNFVVSGSSNYPIMLEVPPDQ